VTARGLGLDAVEIERVAAAVERQGVRFLERVFTEAELVLAGEERAARMTFLAGRFAAKEAVLKALGTGWAKGLAFRDVEVLRNEDGAPQVALHGAARSRADALGITRMLVSITHTRTDAHAVALGE
jgi:holo-[acyl-carrier protein] synthase